MNRVECKQRARECLGERGRESKIVTLVFLLCGAAILVLRYFLLEAIGNMDSGSRYLSDSITGASKSLAISYIAAIVFQILLVLLQAGYTAVTLELRNKNAVAPGSLLAGLRMGRQAVFLYLLITLFECLWSYAFALPVSFVLVMVMSQGAGLLSQALLTGIVFVYVLVVMVLTSYRYRFSWFVLMDHPELTARQALRLATSMNRGHRWKLFVMDLTFLPWLLLGCVTCGVMLVFKLPYMAVSYACAYDAVVEEFAQRQERIRANMEQIRCD